MEKNVSSDQQSLNQETTKVQAATLTQWVQWIVAIAVSGVALFLFVARATYAGSLWRDEADSVQSAQLPFGEMVHAVQYSSFPILFPLVVRVHTTLFGAGNVSLRCFGVAVGILLLAMTWLPIRRLTGNAPLLLPAMIALNANFLIAGMSLRGYGFGSLLVLLAFVCTVRLLLNPNLQTLVSVFVADLACVHCLFWNVPLILSMTIGAVGVLLIRRELRWVCLLTGVLIICGLSEIFYWWQFRSSLSGWEKIIQVPVSFALVWQYFLVAWGDISPTISIIWLAVIFVALVGALWRLVRVWRKRQERERDLLLFGILLVPLSIIASYALGMMIQRSPEQRFFLALTILVAATSDLIWANFPLWLRAARIGLVVLAVITVPFLLWNYIIQAESNAEMIAKIAGQDAGPSDLIVVNPWTYGVSFNWYYRGAARWVSVPEIDDHRIHRYDLVLNKMETPSPLADVKREIVTTLKSGNRVWFAGQIKRPAPGETQFQLSPAPDPKFGWLGSAYREAWSQELGLFLWRRVREINSVDTRTEKAINARENMLLLELEGWKD